MADELTPGMCTVIVAREGAVDRERDEALLRDVEAAFGLRRGSLIRDPGMDRPEFRLLEGVSRDAADRLAGIAVEHGYAPRVRDKLGIKWSNQRGQTALSVGMVLTTAALAMLMTGAAELIGAAALVAGAVLFPAVLITMFALWRRSIYLPLVLDRAALAPRTRSAEAETSPIGAAAAEALQALDELRDTIETEAPDAARGDLLSSHGELVQRVDDLQRQGAGLVLEPSAAAATLAARLERLAPDDPERASLEAVLAEESAAQRDAQARHTAVLTELMGVRRTVRAAVADLLADDPERDPTAGLQAQVAALRDASDEARQRARRAQQARLTRQPGS